MKKKTHQLVSMLIYKNLSTLAIKYNVFKTACHHTIGTLLNQFVSPTSNFVILFCR